MTNAQGAPEFHIVVKRPNQGGPLAPYRMAMSVVFALLIAGGDLWAATVSGIGVDEALTRAGVAGFFLWVLSGIVNKILGNVRPTPLDSPATSPTE